MVHPPQSLAHTVRVPLNMLRVKRRFPRRPAVQFDTVVANVGEARRPEVKFDTIVANTGKACVEIMTLPRLAIDSSCGDLSQDYFPHTARVF